MQDRHPAVTIYFEFQVANRVEKLLPNNIYVPFDAGLCALQQGDLAGAKKWAEELRRRGDADGPGQLAGIVAFLSGDRADAAREFESMDPAKVLSLRLKGYALLGRLRAEQDDPAHALDEVRAGETEAAAQGSAGEQGRFAADEGSLLCEDERRSECEERIHRAITLNNSPEVLLESAEVLGLAVEHAPLVARTQLRGTLNDVARRVPAIANNRAYELTAIRLHAEQLASAGKMAGALTEARRAVSLDQQYSRREQLVRFLLAAAVHEPARGQGMREEARFERSQLVGGPAPRIDAARNLVQLCQLRPQADAEILARIEQLLSDPHPAVRGIVASTLSVLWRRDRETMWKLADWIAQNEPNKAVLSAFTQFLGNVRNADPEHVETSVLTLRDRLAADPVPSDARRGVRENVAALLAMLYVWNGRPQCGSVVREWCTDLVAHETDLDSALSAVRGALVDGYVDDSPAKQGYRQRSQELVARVVDSTSDWLAAYFAQGPGKQSRQMDEATSVAKTLDHTCSQFYFASGAFHATNPREPAGMESLKEKFAFSGEVEPILRRMGDLGAAHTIYHLLQILEFLLPANPGRIFDLIAHALLEGGKRQGYQFDSMGADVFVRIVGVCLADHRDIFRDEPRRQALVDCLDVFIEAGWPSARRLIHRLPELFD